MTKAIRLAEAGGPEVLALQDIDLGAPKDGQVRIRQEAAGVNFIDIYQRSGMFPLSFPTGLGVEAAGVVEDVGPGVSGVAVGDRVAYGTGPLGGYAEAAIVPAGRLLRLPEKITSQQAAGMMLKGLTARMLLKDITSIEAGQTILVMPAAGGVGSILTQWLAHLGATVIGGVGSAAKAELATVNGCHHVIDYSHENIADRVRDITDGAGADVIFDGIGADTIGAALDSARQKGMIVIFGTASGPVKGFDTGLLNQKGSLFLTRPSIMHYAADDTHLAEMAQDLFDVVSAGQVKIEVKQRYALADVARAHRDLEARKTTGSCVLTM